MSIDAIMKLRTFSQVLAALGGPKRVGQMTRTNSSCVCNWRAKRGRFPAKFYDAMQAELKKHGYSAPKELWGQEELTLKREGNERQQQAAA